MQPQRGASLMARKPPCCSFWLATEQLNVREYLLLCFIKKPSIAHSWLGCISYGEFWRRSP